MDYKLHYNKLIQSRQQFNRTKNNDGYLESHHIIPKSLGGSNEKSNLILLTPREHYIAHWLLYKMHTGKDKAKMAYAFFKMCSNNKNQQREFNSSIYVFRKKIMETSCSGENHPCYGKHNLSDEHKQILSERMLGENNPNYGKKPWNYGLSKETSDTMAKISDTLKSNYIKENHPNYGKERSAETKQKISIAHTNKPKSESHKLKLSIANTGKTLSDETKQKMSIALKGKPQTKVQCPHCGKEGGVSSMKHWHFDNCKKVNKH
jgi:hypothetical protein